MGVSSTEKDTNNRLHLGTFRSPMSPLTLSGRNMKFHILTSVLVDKDHDVGCLTHTLRRTDREALEFFGQMTLSPGENFPKSS